ncbi:hypothetical protein D3C87_1743250 [compost metagenome]
MHDGFQQEALFIDVFALQHVGQLLQCVVGIKIGQKTEIAAVNADHLDVVAGQNAGCAEHIAVATDHYCQVGLLANIRQAAGNRIF